MMVCDYQGKRSKQRLVRSVLLSSEPDGEIVVSTPVYVRSHQISRKLKILDYSMPGWSPLQLYGQANSGKTRGKRIRGIPQAFCGSQDPFVARFADVKQGWPLKCILFLHSARSRILERRPKVYPGIFRRPNTGGLD